MCLSIKGTLGFKVRASFLKLHTVGNVYSPHAPLMSLITLTIDPEFFLA